MGIEASYQRMSPEEWNRLDRSDAENWWGVSWDDDDAIASRKSALESEGTFLDIDWAWDGLHFLLTGGSSRENRDLVVAPLRNVVIGGTDTRFEASYGHVRTLSPSEVRDVSSMLDALSLAELQHQYRKCPPKEKQVYKVEAGTSDLEHVSRVFEAVKSFFARAAREGDVVLLSSS
jgi:hypothetical protein